MNLFHVMDFDQVLGKKRGIIVERYDGRASRVSLLLSITLFPKREFLVDFGQQKIFERPEYWLRVSWLSPRIIGNWLGEIEVFRGVGPAGWN